MANCPEKKNVTRPLLGYVKFYTKNHLPIHLLIISMIVQNILQVLISRQKTCFWEQQVCCKKPPRYEAFTDSKKVAYEEPFRFSLLSAHSIGRTLDGWRRGIFFTLWNSNHCGISTRLLESIKPTRHQDSTTE